MDLKNTINNTNMQKENTKKVATQIDNKLVELGGERATDLADVPNKMGAMITENYKKIAIIDYKNMVVNATIEGQWATKDIQVDTQFVPTQYFVITGTEANFSRRNVIDSKLNNSVKTAVTTNSQLHDKAYLTDLGDKKLRIHYYYQGTKSEFIIRILALE